MSSMVIVMSSATLRGNRQQPKKSCLANAGKTLINQP